MTEDITVKHARFSDKKVRKTSERGRVLTMKYGKHQMMLIRKRMNVENWIDDKLNELYNGATDGVDIDVDALLDLDTVSERRRNVLELIRRTHCPAAETQIHDFLEELMRKLDTL